MPGELRHHKSRFLAEDADGFWIEASPEDRSLVDELTTQQTPVGVSFRSGVLRTSFAAPILGRNPAFQVNAQTTLDALHLGFPDEVRAIQRRNNFRVRVPSDGRLTVRVWRIPEHFYLSDKPDRTQELSAQIRDISTGGVGVLVSPKDGASPRVTAGERLRIVLRYESMEELIVEGRMRYIPPEGTPMPIRCGIQFKKLENDMEGRQKLAALTKIVGAFQVEEVRRTRLGIACE
jgi:c-di-GMP-binding flagellar brake protein YcgR